MNIEEIREKSLEIQKYSQILYDRKLVSAAGGNVSARCSDGILITGTNVSLREVSDDGLVYCDISGNVMQRDNNNAKPSKETKFHLAVYKLRDDVNYVIHVHPCYSILWSLTNEPLPMLTQSALLKIKQAPIIPSGKPGSEDLVNKVKNTISEYGKDCDTYLMAEHGILVMGRTMEECFNSAELLEDTAKIAYLHAMFNKK